MRFGVLVLALAFLCVFGQGYANDDFKPRCRAGICDDRPECPRTSCACIYPSRVDCAVYYQCIKGKPTQYRCSPGLLMNPLTLTCDYESNVNCSLGYSTSTTRTESTVSTTTTSPTLSEEVTTKPLKTSTQTITTSLLTSPPTTESSTTVITTTSSETETESAETTMNEPTTTSVAPTASTTSTTAEQVTTTSTAATTTTPQLVSTEESPSTKTLAPTTATQRVTTTAAPVTSTSTTTETSTNTNVPRTVSTKRPTTASTETTTEPPSSSTEIVTSSTLQSTESTSESPSTTISEVPDTTVLQPNITSEITPSAKPTSAPGNFFKCPEYYGLFPDPKNCRRFYHCSHDIPYHKWCPSDLHFNPELLVCDWPYHAGCETFPPPAEGTSSTATPSPALPPTNGTCDCDCCVLPVANDCRSFILCIDGIPFQQQCQHGLYFNPMTGTCDKPENVDCKPEVQCPEADGRFPFPDSCSYFLDCRSGIKHIRKCPEGLNYDDISQTCDWSGTCQGIPDPPPTPLTPLDGENCTCDYCFASDFQDCSNYLLCRHQKLYKGKCADGLLFNDKTETCDYDYNVNCPVTEPPFIQCPSESGYFPYPGKCNLYIQCTQWTPVVKHCPGNLHFDPRRKHCDWPWNAGCASDVHPTPTPGPTPPVIACDCDCCFEPDPDDCAAFTVCINKLGVYRRCSSGLLFNPVTENCDFQEDVECQSHPTDQPIPECSDSEGMSSYPEDCSKYFQCINGHLYVKSCPDNLHFNPQKKICDWPEKAGCSGSPTVEPPTPPPHRPCDLCDSCFIPNKYDCSAYTYCDNGTALEMRCSEGLFFNRDIEDCDSANNVNCPGNATHDCPDASGLYPTDDCSSYILCSNGIPYKKDCPPGLYFNVESHVCDWPENANCGAEPKPPPTPAPLKNCSCDCCFIPDENDCSRYYLCLDNVMTAGRCSDGLRFNRETENCDFEENVDCEPLPLLCKSPDGLFPNPKDCSTFYNCSNGEAIEKACPLGLHFSSDLEMCVDPCIAKCDNNINCTTTTTSTTTVTPISPYCEDLNGLNPNPEDCGSFYHCSNGRAYLLRCPDGLHFNKEHETCERPCEARCDLTINCTTTTTSTTTTTTVTPVSPYCEDLNGLNPNPEDCGSFYHCSNGRAYLVRCPDGLHFNKEHETCERPCEARCDRTIDCTSTTTSITTTTTTKVTVSPFCKEPNGFSPNPTDCGSFYQCSNGRAYLIKCPNGLHFSEEHEVCEKPCEALCDLTIDCRPTTTTSTTTTTTPRPLSPYCKQPDGLNHNPDDCGSFYHCSNGNAYLVKCPDGLHFSVEHEVCERPCDAKCDPIIDCTPSTTPSTTTTSTKIPVSPYCKELNGLNPNPEDCGSFYQCSNGRAYLTKCPDGLHFSVGHEVCERPCDAKCDPSIDCRPTTTTPITTSTTTPTTTSTTTPTTISTTTPTTTSTTTTTTAEVPISTYCKQPDGLNPNPEDCSSFYQCSNGRAYLTKCPYGLHYSVEYEVCEWPCDAKCDPSIDCRPRTTTSTTTTNAAVPLSPYCKQLDGLNPNPEDCGSFYQCSNGRAYLVKCSDGLHFSVEYEVCEWPCDAKCDPSIDCTPSTTTSTTTTIASVPVSKHCIELNGLNPNPEDCGSFHHCSDGRAYLKKCPEGLHFSEDRNVCEKPCDAKCDLSIDCRPTTTTSTTTKTAEVPISPYCKLDGLNPNPEDCGSFYQCSNGRAYLVKCPYGLHYSVEYEVCEWPCDAKCDPSIDCNPPTTTSTTTTSTRTPVSPYCKNHHNDLNPNPEDCGSFYQCSNGQAHWVNCPDGLHFSAEDGICEIPCDAKCDPTVDCPVSPGNCSCEGCYLPDPVDCSAYYFCKDGQMTENYCPYGLLFNKATRQCDTEENVECIPTGDPVMCRYPNGVFPFPGDCQKYVYCENNVAYVMLCSPGEEFNHATGACEEGHGNCGPATVSPHCSSPTGLFPHESNCSLFYHCDHGIAYLKDCPRPLYFNPHLEVCDWPWNVECGQGFTVSGTASSTTTMSSATPTYESSSTTSSATPTYESSSTTSRATTSYESSSTTSSATPSSESPKSSSTTPSATSSSESTSTSSTMNHTYTSSASPTGSVSTTPLPACDIVPGVICPCACRVPTYDECSTFYQCQEDGTACKKSCPLGLYFNKRKLVCDLPKNVECRDFYFSMMKQRQLRKFSTHFELIDV